MQQGCFGGRYCCCICLAGKQHEQPDGSMGGLRPGTVAHVWCLVGCSHCPGQACQLH